MSDDDTLRLAYALQGLLAFIERKQWGGYHCEYTEKNTIYGMRVNARRALKLAGYKENLPSHPIPPELIG